MGPRMRYFDLPIDLPHAATVADRIVKVLADEEGARRRTKEAAATLAVSLMFYRHGENPAEEEQLQVKSEALPLARALVDLIEQDGLTRDRLGQCVRNLFETLGEGKEGAEQSLRAGERPDSPLRP